jgi:phage tail sheath gpL-like
MAMQFNQIPGNIRVPFVRFEVNAGAAPYQSIQKLVLIGQKRTGGSAAVEVPVLVTAGEDALFGTGSMLAGMYKTARANAPFQEIWAIPLADAASSVAAFGTVTIAGAPVAAPGTLVLYVGGLRVAVPVNQVMTNAEIATAVAAAVNACPGMQVTASVALAVVTLTARNTGTLGNTILITTRLYPDDGPMADNLCTIVAMHNGAGDPLITNALASMGDGLWDWIVMPYCTSAYLTEMEIWLDARWGPMSQTYGHNITAMAGTAGEVLAFTTSRNSWHTSVMPTYKAPHPTYLWAAAVGAQAAVHLQSAPELSRPLQTIELVGLLPPKLKVDEWSTVERQSFYYGGASGYSTERNVVRIDRLITTYQNNSWGQPDASFLDINTIAQLVYGIRTMMAYITQIYPRAALVDENPNNIQGFVTPDAIRTAFIHSYKGLVDIGVFENAALFAELLVCERNETDTNRIDTYLPLDHVNQLRVLAVNATSYPQFPTDGSADIAG